jgi:FkbM family methyltransferase
MQTGFGAWQAPRSDSTRARRPVYPTEESGMKADEPPFSELAQRRIEQTTAVHDTDSIPKVQGAGDVITRDGERLQVMHNGVLVVEGGYHGAWMTEVIRRLRGHHEPQEEIAFHTVLERLAADAESPTVIELGSFWAYYSMWARHRIPNARLILLEPDLNNLEVGQRNLALNGMDALILRAAVGSEHDRQVTLTWESDGQPHPARQCSVDGLMSELGLGQIDLLLCDIQGAETEMLLGAVQALAQRRIRFLVLSTHHHSISGDPLTHQRCLRLLRQAGVHLVAEHSVSESCSGDGLIVAALFPADFDLECEVTIVRARDSLFGELEWDLARAQGLSDADRGDDEPSRRPDR